MDDQTQEQMKFIGIFGILSQSFKTIFKCYKIFTQITLTLILPIAIILVAHMHLSDRFFIEENPYQMLADAFEYYKSYYAVKTTQTGWLCYFIFKAFTIIFIVVFSLLSTSVIVYTIASLYTGRDVTFKKSLKVVPKVWKKLMGNFLLMFLTLFAYNLIISVIIFFLTAISQLSGLYMIFMLVMFIAYSFGLVYLSIIWQLAIVVSVLESYHGLKSLIKSMDLIKGKTKLALSVSFIFYVFLGILMFTYVVVVMYDVCVLLLAWRVMIGLIIGVLLVILLLLIIVNETLVYLVCKSYHREVIDQVSLSTYLGAYLSDSQPAFRVGEDIQLGRPHNQSVTQV